MVFKKGTIMWDPQFFQRDRCQTERKTFVRSYFVPNDTLQYLFSFTPPAGLRSESSNEMLRDLRTAAEARHKEQQRFYI